MVQALEFDLIAQENDWLDHIVGLKYFNVYGPNEEHKGNMRSVVSKAYEQIASSGEMTLFTSHNPDYQDGEQMRDFLYVKDSVLMTIWLAEASHTQGLFNLGNGRQGLGWILVGQFFQLLERKKISGLWKCPKLFAINTNILPKQRLRNSTGQDTQTNFFDLEDAVRDYVTQYLVPDQRLGS